MGVDFERAAIEGAMRRRIGMSNEGAERLKRFNQSQSDWYGTCRQCGKARVGTMAELARAHGCEDK